MKILPLMLVNNVVEELSIIIYECEKIIIERLVCTYSDNCDVSSCTLYFNDVPIQYSRVHTTPGREILYIDGIENNSRSFDIHSPCILRFALKLNATEQNAVKQCKAKFLLHLSLELKGRALQKSQISEA